MGQKRSSLTISYCRPLIQVLLGTQGGAEVSCEPKGSRVAFRSEQWHTTEAPRGWPVLTHISPSPSFLLAFSQCFEWHFCLRREFWMLRTCWWLLDPSSCLSYLTAPAVLLARALNVGHPRAVSDTSLLPPRPAPGRVPPGPWLQHRLCDNDLSPELQAYVLSMLISMVSPLAGCVGILK